jgi:hypothetical protein
MQEHCRYSVRRARFCSHGCDQPSRSGTGDWLLSAGLQALACDFLPARSPNSGAALRGSAFYSYPINEVAQPHQRKSLRCLETGVRPHARQRTEETRLIILCLRKA